MSKNILSFGELLWDLFPDGAVLGGAPANFAYRMHALGHRVSLVSRVGVDDLGRQALVQLASLGLNTASIQRDPECPTGTVTVTLDARNNPDFVIKTDTAFDRIQLTPPLVEAAAGADCVCFGSLAQRSLANRQTLAALLDQSPRSLKVLDLNLRRHCYTPETVTQCLEFADALKLNEAEAEYIAKLFQLPASTMPELIQKFISKWELSFCVITLGERGAVGADAQGHTAYEPGYVVEVKDTCGSGDAFTAGFVDGWLRQRSLEDCLRRANALAALASTKPGGTSPISNDEIEALLASAAPRRYDPSL